VAGTITVRRIGAGEARAFATVAPDVFDAPVDPARLADYLREPNHFMVLAFEDDLVVGQCAAVLHRHPDKPTELYIDEVGTASTHRRQGIARLMLDAMFAWGRELGCDEAWLGTELDNVAARGLYDGRSPVEAQEMMFYLFKL
jgi:aminoglycoside 6'-N-acetyltransferase I